MESNDPRSQLDEAARLAAATQREAYNAPGWAIPVLLVAMVVFFTLMGVIGEAWRGTASLGWSLLVLAWVYAIRRPNRAAPTPMWHERSHRRRDIAEWVGLLLAANLITFTLSRVSWALAGLGLAVLASGYGAFSARRARHA